MIVFVATTRSSSLHGPTEVKIIGVFSKKEDAEKALQVEKDNIQEFWNKMRGCSCWPTMFGTDIVEKELI